jgi:acyl-CoA synthetase (AMP-forming)/AMP-acid ligase II
MTAANRIHLLFDRWLAEAPDRDFIHLPDATLTYGDVGRMATAAEAEMRADGVVTGDRVLVVAENCPAHVAMLIACSRIGAWSCGVNARMAPAEISAFLEMSDARVAYFTAGVSSAAAAHGQRLGAVPSVIDGLTRIAPRPQAVAETGPLAEQVAAIIFTSGTTGAPKGVMMTQDGVCHFGRVSAASRQLTPEDHVYAYVPMTHIFGIGTVLTASLVSGALLVMRQQFDPADLLDALARHGITQLQGPPALFARLLAFMEEKGIVHPEAPRLRYVYTGAGPLDMALKLRIEEAFGLPLHHGYGLSEYAGSVYLSKLNERRNDTAAGYRLEGAELRIVDTDGNDLPQGQRGEIWLRGRGLMPGYFRNKEATDAVMREGGWYASGDLGEIGPDGALFVVGRLKEMIIRSGFNVYPAEVESALNTFPSIQRSAVVGRREADGNEEIVAFVEVRQGQTLDQAALHAHLKEQLAPYKRPARILPISELPMSANGKLLKRELVQRLA